MFLFNFFFCFKTNHQLFQEEEEEEEDEEEDDDHELQTRS